MQNFTFNIPTVVHFGKGQISKLGEEIASRASRVLVVYGGGSVKRNGVYDGAVEQMKAHGIEWVELPQVRQHRSGQDECGPPHLWLHRHPVLESGPDAGNSRPRPPSVRSGHVLR